jgi:hypothetical protein
MLLCATGQQHQQDGFFASLINNLFGTVAAAASESFIVAVFE